MDRPTGAGEITRGATDSTAESRSGLRRAQSRRRAAAPPRFAATMAATTTRTRPASAIQLIQRRHRTRPLRKRAKNISLSKHQLQLPADAQTHHTPPTCPPKRANQNSSSRCTFKIARSHRNSGWGHLGVGAHAAASPLERSSTSWERSWCLPHPSRSPSARTAVGSALK